MTLESLSSPYAAGNLYSALGFIWALPRNCKYGIIPPAPDVCVTCRVSAPPWIATGAGLLLSSSSFLAVLFLHAVGVVGFWYNYRKYVDRI